MVATVVGLTLPHLKQKATTDMPPALSLPARAESIDAAILPAILDMYLASKLADGTITPKTERNYYNNLAPWRAYWRDCADVHRNQLSPAIFAHAMTWMRTDYRNERGRHPAANSIAHCWVRLRQVLRWAYENNCTGTTNLCDWAPVADFVAPNVHYPTTDELAAILAQPAGEHRLRDTAAIAFLVSTGARRYEASCAEVEAITWTGVNVCNLDVGADHAGWVQLRRVKGDKDGHGPGRPVAFDSACGLLLKAYLRSVGRTHGTIFDMSDNALGQMVDRHAHAAGCGLVSPHAFRRMLADWWDENRGLEGRAALKKQLGHAPNSGDVTERHYISRNTKRIARELCKWHVSPLQAIPVEWTLYPVHMP